MSQKICIVNIGFLESERLESARYTSDASRVMHDAVARAVRRGALGRVHPAAVLWSLLRWEKTLGVSILEACGANTLSLEQDTAALRVSELDINDYLGNLIDQVIDCQLLGEVASTACKQAQTLGRDYVGTEHLVLALLRTEDESLRALFAKYNLTHEVYQAKLAQVLL